MLFYTLVRDAKIAYDPQPNPRTGFYLNERIMREFPKAQSNMSPTREVYTVDRLNKAARKLLESTFSQVWVEGEISNLSAPGSGHLYFTLKDGSAQIRCAYFLNRRALLGYSPADGDQALIRARLTIYEPRGDFQLVVQHIEPAGEGALRLRFENLKRALKAEGLFDASNKKPLPAIPRKIGIITSPTGAAVRDIISTCRRRFAALPLVIYATPVQGGLATDGVVQALETAQQRSECDVLILARGGGSLEDLWVFNEERVARAIVDCTLPIVTGIGHETDITIADFVADIRAPTPTAAAELTVPDGDQLRRQVDSGISQVLSHIRRKIEQAMQRNDLYSHRLIHPTRQYAQARHQFQLLYGRLGAAFKADLARKKLDLNTGSQTLLRHSPENRLHNVGWRLHGVRQRLAGSGERSVISSRQRLHAAATRLDSVSPLATLDRGYALVTDESGKVVTNARTVRIDSSIDVKLASGVMNCRVEKIQK
jgi:exodeoxyribonuclease VII large subunit